MPPSLSDETREALRRAGLLSPADLSAFLGVPLATVYRWNATGDGPPFMRIGKHARYDPDAVADWLAAHPGSRAA